MYAKRNDRSKDKCCLLVCNDLAIYLFVCCQTSTRVLVKLPGQYSNHTLLGWHSPICSVCVRGWIYVARCTWRFVAIRRSDKWPTRFNEIIPSKCIPYLLTYPPTPFVSSWQGSGRGN